MRLKHFIIFISLLLAVLQPASAQFTDFSEATICLVEENKPDLQVAARVFQEMVEERSHIQLPIVYGTQLQDKPLIFISTDQQLSSLPEGTRHALDKLSPAGKDGYRIVSLPEKETLVIVGHDGRGALYGVGYVLRKMELRKNRILLPEDLMISSTPKYPIRGHQLGYRPKTNAYNAWS